MKSFLMLLPLIIMFSFACSQQGENESKTTDSENMVEEQRTETVEKDQKDAESEDLVNRVKTEKSGKVVARVNGVPIYEVEVKNTSLDSAITDEILYQHGLKRGLDKNYEDRVMDYQMALIIRDIKSSILEDLPPVKVISDEEIEEYYKANKDKYINIKLEEINFSDKEKADEIKKMAEEGKEFRDIKDQYPDSDVKFNELGYNRQLIKYFDTKETGAVSGVVGKNDGTYSILRIVEISEISLKQVSNAIRHGLEARREANAFDEYAKKISEENNFKIEIIDNSNNK